MRKFTANQTFGFNLSKIDGTEHKFEPIPSMNLPEEYSFIQFLSPIQNQGKTNMCVTYSISAHLNWNKNVDTDGENHRDNNVNLNQIYAARKTKGDNGMSFKEALTFLRHSGVQSDLGKMKIERYSMITSALALKQALLLNGPCVGGMMVYNASAHFWNKNNYEGNYGGHAISIVGYTKKGFIIRNSWGTSWGTNGYSILSYADYDKYMLECWTIID